MPPGASAEGAGGVADQVITVGNKEVPATHRPPIAPEPGTLELQVELLLDDRFALVRQVCGVSVKPAEFAKELDASGFMFSDLAPGGGKGGDLMCFTADGLYLIKEVSCRCCLPACLPLLDARITEIPLDSRQLHLNFPISQQCSLPRSACTR